jgi:hypothetical protein
MNSQQIEIGNFILKLIEEKGQADTDNIFLSVKEYFNMDAMETTQIGITKAHLIRLNLIESLGDSDYFFALTNEGRKAVTGIEGWMKRKDSSKDVGDEYITSDQLRTLNEKIDFVLEGLSTMKYELQTGQQVIYDEIEELKNLPALKKKNVYEIILGKLTKLAFDQLITKEVFHKIFKELTGTDIKLLGE